MDNFTHTLSAYELKFEKRRGFSNHSSDLNCFSIEKLIELIVDSYNDNEICKTTGYVLKLRNKGQKVILENGVKRYLIFPDSGRRGRPTTLYRIDVVGKQPYNFSANWASTYQNNVFLYEFPNGRIFSVFHRVGKSGCKTIFNSLCNELLKKKGISMHMYWIPPRSSKVNMDKTIDIRGIKLIYRESNNSSDIADSLVKKRRKCFVAKELRLDFRSKQNSKIKKIIDDCKLKMLPLNNILEEIRPVLNDDYNDAIVNVSFGGVTRSIPWDDIENLFDGFDVTNEVKNTGSNFINKLTACCDKYIFTLNEELKK